MSGATLLLRSRQLLVLFERYAKRIAYQLEDSLIAHDQTTTLHLDLTHFWVRGSPRAMIERRWRGGAEKTCGPSNEFITVPVRAPAFNRHGRRRPGNPDGAPRFEAQQDLLQGSSVQHPDDREGQTCDQCEGCREGNPR